MLCEKFCLNLERFITNPAMEPEQSWLYLHLG